MRSNSAQSSTIRQRSVLDDHIAPSPVELEINLHLNHEIMPKKKRSVLDNTAALSPGQSCNAQSQEIMLAQGVKWTKSSVLRISFMQWNFHWSRSLRKYEKMLTGNGYFFIHLLTSRPTSSDPPKTLANLIRLHVTSCTGM